MLIYQNLKVNNKQSNYIMVQHFYGPFFCLSTYKVLKN